MKVLQVFLLLAISGCATLRNVDTGNESSIRTALQEGDRISVTTRDDQQYQLTVAVLSADAISGRDRDGQLIVIAYEEVIQLQVREPSPGRTAALVGGTLGGIAVVYALATAAAAAAIVGGL